MINPMLCSKLQDWQNRRVYTHVAFKLKLKKVVCDFGSTLTRKNKHLVPADSYREVATRWRNLTTLIDLMATKTEMKASAQYTTVLFCVSISMLF